MYHRSTSRSTRRCGSSPSSPQPITISICAANNIATDSYFHPGTHQNYLCRLEANGRLGQSKAKIRLAAYLSPVACICENIYNTSDPPRYSTIPSIAPKDLKTLNFVADAGTINGEGKIILWGWKLYPKGTPPDKSPGDLRLFRCWRRRNGSFTSSFPLPTGPKPVQILASRVSVQEKLSEGVPTGFDYA